jgi:histidine ammonia-lyase
VSDNPLVLAEEGKIVSAGNFHGPPVASALDFLAIALAELGSISERRTHQLLTGAGGESHEGDGGRDMVSVG